jgi:HNH endonuclease
MTDNGPGHRANQTKLAQYGPDELRRTKQKRDWTLLNKSRPGSANPYNRENFYRAEELAQAERFESWKNANPDRSHQENPFTHPGALPMLDDFRETGRSTEETDAEQSPNLATAEPNDTVPPEDNVVPPNEDEDRSEDAIDDLDTGSPADRAKTTGYRYKRDPTVRNKVKRRANGLCEYCERPGFMDVDGQPFLECHHIIALAEQGHDKPWNVIALCAEP